MKVARYPVVALGLLAAVDGFHAYALLVLAPDIAATLGLSPSAVGALALLGLVSAAIVALPLAETVARAGARAVTAVGAGLAWAAGLAATGLVTGPWALAGLVAADGASSGATRALHPALVADVYPEGARVRALSAHRALAAVGAIGAPALVAALSAAGLTWRGVYLALGGVAAVAALAAVRVRDPRPVAGRSGAVTPTVVERARGVLAVPTARRILAAYAVAGVFLAPLIGHLLVFLEARWGLGPSERGGFFALTGAVTIGVLALFATEGERRLQQGPAALLDAVWRPAALAAAALALAVAAPGFGVAVGALCAAFACLALAQTGLLAALLTVVTVEARTAAAALGGIALAGIGGTGGLLLTAGMTDAIGGAGGVAVLAIPALAAALVIRSAAATADADRDEAAAGTRRVAVAASARWSGPAAPALACQAIEFSYDHRRVLCGVDLAVAPGETVALLGTNGAGKTTLLRVLSGLAAPSAGTVLLGGEDVTFLDPERRVALGLVHLAGGASTFPGLTVRDHLRLLDPTGERAALARFEALARRVDVPAERLSGGERQLLGLAGALLARPRVLLVDEPTRNLSQDAAAEVLTVLRELAADGVALVVVEQALGTVAAIAERAVFLERGEVRFDGPLAALRQRSDLVRPVFLAAAGGGA